MWQGRKRRQGQKRGHDGEVDTGESGRNRKTRRRRGKDNERSTMRMKQLRMNMYIWGRGKGERYVI